MTAALIVVLFGGTLLGWIANRRAARHDEQQARQGRIAEAERHTDGD